MAPLCSTRARSFPSARVSSRFHSYSSSASSRVLAGIRKNSLSSATERARSRRCWRAVVFGSGFPSTAYRIRRAYTLSSATFSSSSSARIVITAGRTVFSIDATDCLAPPVVGVGLPSLVDGAAGDARLDMSAWVASRSITSRNGTSLASIWRRHSITQSRVRGLSTRASTAFRRPISMRLAIAISPSRVSRSMPFMSRRYMRTGSSVRPVISFGCAGDRADESITPPGSGALVSLGTSLGFSTRIELAVK